MNARALTLFFLAVALLAATGVITATRSTTRVPEPATSETPQVVASVYPVGEFVRHVGGSFVSVTVLTPGGTEPHEYEPTPQDVARAQSATLLIFNGGGIDVWAERLAPDFAQKGVRVLGLDERLTFLRNADGAVNPHFWLDPVRAQDAVAAIRDALIDADPARAEAYRVQSEQYIEALSVLDETYRAGLVDCRRRDVVTSHDAFGYLAERYGLSVLPIAGLSPEAEPTAKRLAELAALVKQRDIRYVFFETLASPRIAETLAREVGARTLVLHTLEGLTAEDVRGGKEYLSLMTDNLTNLRTALECR